MQLFAEDGNIDRAIRELEAALPVEALKSILEDRIKKHKPRSHIRRQLQVLRARQMENEAA